MNIGKLLDFLRCLNGVVAGTTVQNGTVIDMKGWDGVIFLALFGAITATGVQGLKAQQGTQVGGGDMADLAGTLVSVTDAQSNKAAVLDLFRPQERYVRAVVNRSVANAVIDGVVAIRYKGRKAPSIADATIAAAKYLQSPAEGTA